MRKGSGDVHKWRFGLMALAGAVLMLGQWSTTVAQENPQETPLATITRTLDAVIAALADQSLSQATKKRQVKAIVGRGFDFRAMANRVLATNWSKADKDQRTIFTQLFRELLTNTYWRKISGYSNEKVEYVGEKMRSQKLATVNTVIKTDSADIPVDYKPYLKGTEWLAYDVVIEQVSLVRNYRSSFQDIVRNDGIDGPINRLETKVAESSVDEESRQEVGLEVLRPTP